MKKRYIFIIALLTFCFFFSEGVFASRAFAPIRIGPITYKDIIIVGGVRLGQIREGIFVNLNVQ